MAIPTFTTNDLRGSTADVPAAVDAAASPAAAFVARAVASHRLGALLDCEDIPLPHAALDSTLLGPTLEFLARPGKALRARLVEIGWELGGGAGAVPVELPSLLELVHAGSLVVDDIEDGSCERRGAPALHRRVGVPLALNAGNWLYFLPLQLLADLGLPPPTELGLYRAMTSAMARCHVGQAVDLGVRVDELAQDEIASTVRFVTTCKTAALTELATSLGAIAAGAGDGRRRALARFGRRFGMALQMLDDLAGVQGRQGDARRWEDVRLGRVTWPWAWLAERSSPERFARLQRAARAVADGRLAPGTLGQRLSTLSAAHGRQVARGTLARALDALARAVGSDARLDDVRAEVDRLLVSYG
jgi:geranylgeranyl pyrophosphate synthase